MLFLHPSAQQKHGSSLNMEEEDGDDDDGFVPFRDSGPFLAGELGGANKDLSWSRDPVLMSLTKCKPCCCHVTTTRVKTGRRAASPRQKKMMMMRTRHHETLFSSSCGFGDFEDDVGQEGLVKEQWRHHLVLHD
nr:hypothetical protein Iba_chr07fCG12350 [Ipomoea batatas]